MKLKAAIALLVFFWTTLTQAEMKIFPLWEEKQCDGQTWGCYPFDQVKDILKLDLNLQLKLKSCELWEQKYGSLDEAYLKLRRAFDLTQDVRIRLETRLDEKNVVIQDLSKQVHKYADRDIWGFALPWVVVVVVLAFAGGVVAGVYISK